LYHLQSNSASNPTTWTAPSAVGGDNTDFPAATMSGSNPVVYIRGVNSNHFWEVTKSGGSWSWLDLSNQGGSPAMRGSPSVSYFGSTAWVDGADTTGKLI